jgi:hypothetical protein
MKLILILRQFRHFNFPSTSIAICAIVLGMTTLAVTTSRTSALVTAAGSLQRSLEATQSQ